MAFPMHWLIRPWYCCRAVVQFQGRISQCIGDGMLREVRACGANNHPLWFSPLNHEPANHHVVTRLNERARRDVLQDSPWNYKSEVLVRSSPPGPYIGAGRHAEGGEGRVVKGHAVR